MITTKLELLQEMSNLREVWNNEASDFTPWLAKPENLGLLCEAIGIGDLEDVTTESNVGKYRADIVGVEADGKRVVVIENQLEGSNHDHLGKIITYAASKQASIVVWLVKTAYDEHRSAIQWLNQHTDDDIAFFLCEIKLFRIGNSSPAVKFDVVEAPNAWVKVGKVRSDAPQGKGKVARFEFWQAFVEYAFEQKDFGSHFNRRKPTTDHWLSFYIGIGGCRVSACQKPSKGIVYLKFAVENDKDLFHYLLARKSIIEGRFGGALDWFEAPNAKECSARLERPFPYSSKDKWNSGFDWIIETAIGLKQAFKPAVEEFYSAVANTDESVYCPEK